MKWDLVEPTLVIIRNLQKVGSFVGGIMFILGLVMFLYSFKNPLKKRTAYLLTLLGPTLLLVSIHGVVFLAHYMFNQPLQTDGSLGLLVFEPKLDGIGQSLYQAIKYISYPIMVFVILTSFVILHHASSIPGRKRIGFGIFALVPVLFLVIEGGPWIYSILIS